MVFTRRQTEKMCRDKLVEELLKLTDVSSKLSTIFKYVLLSLMIKPWFNSLYRYYYLILSYTYYQKLLSLHIKKFYRVVVI